MDLGMTMLRPMSRSPEKGAETLVWLHLARRCECERGILLRPGAKAAEPRGTGHGDRGAAVGDQRAAVRGLGAKRRSPIMTRPAKQAYENRVRDRGLCCSRSGG